MVQAERLEFVGEDGIRLAAEAWGESTNPPVLLSHGGGQTRHSWGSTASKLAADGWYAVAYDHRGHGESEWSTEAEYDLVHFALDMACLARSFDRPPVVVGASLGGMAALLGAGEIEIGIYAAIVLVDVTPKLNHDGVARIMEFMREHLESGFPSLDAAAEAVASYAGRSTRRDHSGLRKNLRERDGRYYWHWDPQFFAPRHDVTQISDRIAGVADQVDIPILLVRGASSDVVTEQEVEDFLKLIPHAEYLDVDRAQHMVAGDRNDVFSESVVEFLQRIKSDEL